VNSEDVKERYFLESTCCSKELILTKEKIKSNEEALRHPTERKRRTYGRRDK